MGRVDSRLTGGLIGMSGVGVSGTTGQIAFFNGRRSLTSNSHMIVNTSTGEVTFDVPLQFQGGFQINGGVGNDGIFRDGATIQFSTTGSDRLAGIATLAGGTVTVPCANIRNSSLIFLTAQDVGSGAGTGTWGDLAITNLSDNTSFDIISDNAADDRLIGWFAFNLA